MFKVAAFICFVFAGAVVGTVFSDKLRQSRDYCRKIVSMLSDISVMIRHRALDVYEIVSELRYSGVYENVQFLYKLPEQYKTGENFHELWRTVLSDDLSLNDEERAILLNFGNSFGTSDIEGQLMNISAALEHFKVLELKRSEEYTRKGKMYRSIGLLFGMMAGIMIV